MTEELKRCPFCGGAIDERGGSCNYSKKIMILDLKCEECGTIFKFKSKWTTNPYQEAIEAWNRRTEGEELEFTRGFIHDNGLDFALASAWNRRMSG